MFKTKLHEYCHSKAWLLPEFGVEREGPNHCPRFKAVVVVNGNSFTSPHFSRSIKEAHNLAAKLAYEYFVGCSNLGMTETSAPVPSSVQLNSSTGANRVAKDNNMPKDKGSMYKHQLQVYAQKRKFELPVYSTEREGPVHSGLFKSKVTLEGKTYESEESFNTLKKAEASAAKVALASIIPEGTQEDDPYIYKNLLQEYLLKETSCFPKYTTIQAGPPHKPIFFSTVEIRGETFKGELAITKKQAELYVAKVAYMTVRERGLKQYDKLNVVGSTTQVIKTPQIPSVEIPNVVGPTTQVMKTPQSSPADVGTLDLPKIATSDAQFLSSKQNECVEGIEAISNDFTRIAGSKTSSGSIENLEATSPYNCPHSPPYDSSSLAYTVEPSADEGRKKKKKIMVLPQSTSPDPSVSILHSDEKWIAVTGKSD